MLSGNCPKCNSTDLKYDTLEVHDTCISYPFECSKCGFKGFEWYNLTFSGFTDENNKELLE